MPDKVYNEKLLLFSHHIGYNLLHLWRKQHFLVFASEIVNQHKIYF